MADGHEEIYNRLGELERAVAAAHEVRVATDRRFGDMADSVKAVADEQLDMRKWRERMMGGGGVILVLMTVYGSVILGWALGFIG